MIKKIFLLFLLISIFCSCGASKTNNGAGALVSNETERAEGNFQLKIKDSSSKLVWKASYTNTLDEMFSEPIFDSFFDAIIEQKDLNIVGCPSLNSFGLEEKKLFYIAFIAAIAEAESDYEVAQETYNKSDRTMNIGLLQIDRASAKRHGAKVFNRNFTNEDLKNADLNLKIGALILKNQITGSVSHNRLFPGTIYYWQVLSGDKKRFLKNIKANLISLKSCDSPL